MFVRRSDVETENASQKFEADELDEVRNRISAGAFMVNIQRERRHRGGEGHDCNRDAVVQTWKNRAV